MNRLFIISLLSLAYCVLELYILGSFDDFSFDVCLLYMPFVICQLVALCVFHIVVKNTILRLALTFLLLIINYEWFIIDDLFMLIGNSKSISSDMWIIEHIKMCFDTSSSYFIGRVKPIIILKFIYLICVGLFELKFHYEDS